MKEETPNSNMHWKSKLDELDASPVTSWERLETRLAAKSKNKRVLGWYVAAACILVVVSLLFIKLETAEKYPLKDTAASPPSKIILYQPPAVSKLPLPQKSVSTIHTKKTNQISLSKEMMSNQASASPTNPLPPETEPQQYVPAAPRMKPDTPILVNTSTAPAQTRSKLRVVHINELQAPTGEAKRDFFIRSYVSNSASDQILKIDLTPSN